MDAKDGPKILIFPSVSEFQMSFKMKPFIFVNK